MLEDLKMLFQSPKRYRRYKNSVAELSRLTDRELRDIGISRSDIPRIVRKSDLARSRTYK